MVDNELYSFYFFAKIRKQPCSLPLLFFEDRKHYFAAEAGAGAAAAEAEDVAVLSFAGCAELVVAAAAVTAGFLAPAAVAALRRAAFAFFFADFSSWVKTLRGFDRMGGTGLNRSLGKCSLAFSCGITD